MTQFYVPYLKSDSNQVIISSSEFHHIVKSHRAKIGDVIKLFNGKGLVCLAKIKKISKDNLEAEILEKNFYPKKEYEIVLCQGLIKLDKFEMIIEKTTELGVDKIIPVYLARSSVKPDSFLKKYERFKTIAIESSKQSDRIYIPEIFEVKKLEDLFREQNIEFLNIVFYKDSQRNLLELKDFIKNSKKIRLFIGPEGDFSEEEIEFFKKQKNSYFASLSNNILRSETAAILSVGIVKLMG